MHHTALLNCKAFFDTYGPALKDEPKVRVVEIGSQDVNGSLRSVVPPQFEYIGVDFAPAPGVDIVLEDPYVLPFVSESIDIIISSSCFEHSEMFWLVFIEVLRTLKPTGLFYLNVPSNGSFHRYPVDCWRFYPDSGKALIEWAKRNHIPAILLESYTSFQVKHMWNDFVAVFLKDEAHISKFVPRILHTKSDIFNGLMNGSDDFINLSELTEDQHRLYRVQIEARRASAAPPSSTI